MAATYSVVLSSPLNLNLLTIANFASLEYTRSVNAVGVMTLVLPATFDRSLISRDSRLEIWRHLEGRKFLETKTQWLVNRAVLNVDAHIFTVQALSAMDLLRRRIVAYDSGTSQSTKSGAADSIIVEFVDENLGSAVSDSDRDWSSLVDIKAAAGTGPTANKSASRRNLLQTVQEIAQAAATDGTPVFFDMEYNPDSGKQEFWTFIGQRGIDHTQALGGVTLSLDRKNITGVIQGNDYTDEITFAYAAGQGTGSDRTVQTASDDDRIGSSPFGRKERLVDSRNTDATDELLNEARAAVREGRPRRIFNGEIVDVPGTRYGIHWDWGDKLMVQVDNDVFQSRVDTLQVNVSAGKETIRVQVRAED